MRQHKNSPQVLTPRSAPRRIGIGLAVMILALVATGCGVSLKSSLSDDPLVRHGTSGWIAPPFTSYFALHQRVPVASREPAGGLHEGDGGAEGVPSRMRAEKRRANRVLARSLRHHRAPLAHKADTGPPSVGVYGGLNAPGASGGTPPDTNGAIGLSHYVEFINAGIAVYRRSDLSQVVAQTMNGFSCCSRGSDPEVIWDQQAQRWFYTIIGEWGFSKTADPCIAPCAQPSDVTNAWCHYPLGESPTVLGPNGQMDSPKIGTSANDVVISANIYNSYTYTTARIWAIAKPPSGTAATCPSLARTGWGDWQNPLLTGTGRTAWFPIAVNNAGGSPNGYVVATDVGNDSQLTVWHVNGPANTPTLTTDGDFAVAPFQSPPDIALSTGASLWSLYGNITNAVEHADPDAGGHDAIWTQHTIARPDNAGHAVVAWYELLPLAGTVRQQGTVSDPTYHVFNAGISPTGAGSEAVIHYNVGDQALAPEIRARARRSGTPLGQMGNEITVAASTGSPSCTTRRWGDYATGTVDPTDSHVVWGTNELTTNGSNCTTRNFALQPLNLVPVAGFGVSPVSPVAGQLVTLTSSSSDPDGTLATQEWDLDGDGQYGDAVGVSASRSFAHSGTYTVGLRVTDNDGAIATASRQVMVATAPPVASFVVSPATPSTAESVTFTSTASDPDGSIVSQVWDLGGGQLDDGTGTSASRTFAHAGSYTIRLRVTDDEGASTIASQSVTVSDRPPVAGLTVTPAAVCPGQVVTFDASGSSDPDGSIVGYRWDLDGDGSYETDTGDSAVASHAYANAGTYTIGVRVSDDSASTATATRQVIVGGTAVWSGVAARDVAQPSCPATGTDPGTGGPGPEHGSGGTDDPIGPGVLRLGVRAPRAVTIAWFLTHGLGVRVSCSLACRVDARLRIDVRHAHRLQIATSTPLLVGHRRRRLAAASYTSLRLHARRRLGSRLRRSQHRPRRHNTRVPLTLTVIARTSTDQVQSRNLAVGLARHRGARVRR